MHHGRTAQIIIKPSVWHDCVVQIVIRVAAVRVGKNNTSAQRKHTGFGAACRIWRGIVARKHLRHIII